MPDFGDLELGNAAACRNVCKRVDVQEWEEAVLTLVGDASEGLEYQDNMSRYTRAKRYLESQASEAGVDLTNLYDQYLD